MTSDPSLTENTRHVVTAENGGLVRRFKVQDNCITFRDVETTDTGSYTISCLNAKGLEGKATFELKILVSSGKFASGQSTFRYKDNLLHNHGYLSRVWLYVCSVFTQVLLFPGPPPSMVISQLNRWPSVSDVQHPGM